MLAARHDAKVARIDTDIVSEPPALVGNAQEDVGELCRALALRVAEHYDPAYRRSSARNFTRLSQAQVVKISSAEETGFSGAARALLEEPVPA